MGKHRLAGIRAKLDRADEQLKNFNEEWGRFLNDEKPYTVTFKYGVDTDQNLVVKPTFEVSKDPPLRLSVLAGEIVHNIRSALDHLACELIEVHGSRPARRTAWPIALTEDTWVHRVECPSDRTGKRLRGPLHGLDPRSDAWAYVKRAQPYQRGEAGARRHPLTELNRLSNADKHSVIHMTYVYPALGVYDMFRCNLAALMYARPLLDGGQPLKENAAIAIFTFDPRGPHPNMKVKRELPFDIALGDIVEGAEKGRGDASLADIRHWVADIVTDCRVWTG